MPHLLLSCVQASSQAQGLWQGLAAKHNWRSASAVRGLLEQGSFTWLKALLAEPQTTQQELVDSALCSAVLQLLHRPELDIFVAQSLANTNEWRQAVLSQLPNQTQAWQATTDIDSGDGAMWQLLSYIAPEERASLATATPCLHILLSLNDSLACKPTSEVFASGQALSTDAKNYKDKWRAIWQAFNVLQYAPSLSVATQSGLQAGLFVDLLAADAHVDTAHAQSSDTGWQDVAELSCLSPEQLQALQDITQSAPQVGMDLTDSDGATIGTAELVWQHLTVAVFVEESELLPELTGWQCISMQSPQWLELLKTALEEE